MFCFLINCFLLKVYKYIKCLCVKEDLLIKNYVVRNTYFHT